MCVIKCGHDNVNRRFNKRQTKVNDFDDEDEFRRLTRCYETFTVMFPLINIILLIVSVVKFVIFIHAETVIKLKTFFLFVIFKCHKLTLIIMKFPLFH